MKKVLILILTLVTLTSVACGKGDTDVSKKILGTWEWENRTSPWGEGWDDAKPFFQEITFYSDGTCSGAVVVRSGTVGVYSYWFEGVYSKKWEFDTPQNWIYLKEEQLLKLTCSEVYRDDRFYYFKVSFKTGKLILENRDCSETKNVEYIKKEN